MSSIVRRLLAQLHQAQLRFKILLACLLLSELDLRETKGE